MYARACGLLRGVCAAHWCPPCQEFTKMTLIPNYIKLRYVYHDGMHAAQHHRMHDVTRTVLVRMHGFSMAF